MPRTPRRAPCLPLLAALALVAACSHGGAPPPSETIEGPNGACWAERPCPNEGVETRTYELNWCYRVGEAQPSGIAETRELALRCETAATCKDGWDCVSGRCRPRACAADADCGASDLTCGAESGQCEPRACTRSADCSGGRTLCVRGACSHERGVCGYPPWTPLP